MSFVFQRDNGELSASSTYADVAFELHDQEDEGVLFVLTVRCATGFTIT